MNGPSKISIRLGERDVGPGFRCFIIAEIGTGHNGDPLKAVELIDAAAGAGADCVKTQMVFAEEILHPATGTVSLPGGETPLFERFRSLERDIDFFRSLKAETEKRGMVFLCTPFGLKSAGLLKELGVVGVKIASPELNHYPLLAAASFGVPMILSTGVSTLGDIERALAAAGPKTALLHCVTSYPAPPEDYNLGCLENMRRIFGVPVGVSDHSADPVLVPAVAVYAGADMLEKHITLENRGTGLDDTFALNPEGFTSMTAALRDLENMAPEQREAWLVDRFGENTFQRVLGDGVKRLSPSERDNYRTSNRSVLALQDLDAGTRLTVHNISLLRSEKNLKPGLGPEVWKIILGKTLKRPVKAGNGITWEDLFQ